MGGHPKAGQENGVEDQLDNPATVANAPNLEKRVRMQPTTTS